MSMTTATVLETGPRVVGGASPRRGELATLMQESFTTAARLRANRQVAQDAEAFRSQTKQLLAVADQEARQAGYDPATVKLAIYAFVAFLDESVLNSGQPMFAAWPRQPLQEEIFGDHMAGQTFFSRLDELLGQPDSEDLADLLEVFLLCLLLGFKGRYGSGDDGGLRERISATRAKIERIRGGAGPIAPAAGLPAEERAPTHRDRWLPRLAIIAAGTAVVVILLFFAFRLSLGSLITEIEALSTQIRG
jgi:type VI secretion system protein ImpK